MLPDGLPYQDFITLSFEAREKLDRNQARYAGPGGQDPGGFAGGPSESDDGGPALEER